MDAGHEARKASKADRDCWRANSTRLAGKPQRRDGLARRQAGAFAEKKFSVFAFVMRAVFSGRTLGEPGSEDKAACARSGQLNAPGKAAAKSSAVALFFERNSPAATCWLRTGKGCRRAASRPHYPEPQ